MKPSRSLSTSIGYLLYKIICLYVRPAVERAAMSPARWSPHIGLLKSSHNLGTEPHIMLGWTWLGFYQSKQGEVGKTS